LARCQQHAAGQTKPPVGDEGSVQRYPPQSSDLPQRSRRADFWAFGYFAKRVPRPMRSSCPPAPVSLQPLGKRVCALFHSISIRNSLSVGVDSQKDLCRLAMQMIGARRPSAKSMWSATNAVCSLSMIPLSWRLYRRPASWHIGIVASVNSNPRRRLCAGDPVQCAAKRCFCIMSGPFARSFGEGPLSDEKRAVCGGVGLPADTATYPAEKWPDHIFAGVATPRGPDGT
jgi:hypothetical protein